MTGGRKKNYTTTYKGLIPYLEKIHQEGDTEKQREKVEMYATWRACPQCEGYRLNNQALQTRVHGIHIGQLADKNVSESLHFFESMKLPSGQQDIAAKVLKNCFDRLQFLRHVGLNYITLSRRSNTLS